MLEEKLPKIFEVFLLCLIDCTIVCLVIAVPFILFFGFVAIRTAVSIGLSVGWVLAFIEAIRILRSDKQ